MSRRNLIRTPLYPYHVTTRTINKDWFDIPLSEVWQIALHCLKEANKKHPVEIMSFVLMANHYHLLLKTPGSDLDSFMYEFNKNFANILLQRSIRISRVFGGRYKWCLIRSQTYLYNCYRYIYQNPLRAGVVSECEDYPYSTLHNLVHQKSLPFAIYDPFGFKDKYFLQKHNQDLTPIESESVKKGLSRSLLTKLINHETRERL